ncbi:hypothetical protein TNIN_307811 [Trichonephila inaurata madagascariensis]|uniref:Uncharacterized protein n=1 Tax=Trichonephila inaurata madagascariensis TaxID=2747483 RepID=A0A8X6KN71_9ARAC|nr:hypothetical protein TNIN_307811 [Trichonephila inaurata madagascariensis]
MLRNISQPKLCNALRPAVKFNVNNFLEVTIDGIFKGEVVLFCRFSMIPVDMPFQFKIMIKGCLDKLERVQISAARDITGFRNGCPRNIVLCEADLQPLRIRSRYHWLCTFPSSSVMVTSTGPLVMCAIGTTFVVLREEVHLVMLKARDGCIKK